MVDQYGPYPRWNTATAELYHVYHCRTPLSVTGPNTPLQPDDNLDARTALSPQPSSFGVRALPTFDPGLKRPYSLMYNLGLTHELLPGTSVTAEWFHSDFKNLIARNNVLRTAADYTLINVASPIDGTTIPYYNI